MSSQPSATVALSNDCGMQAALIVSGLMSKVCFIACHLCRTQDRQHQHLPEGKHDALKLLSPSSQEVRAQRKV